MAFFSDFLEKNRSQNASISSKDAGNVENVALVFIIFSGLDVDQASLFMYILEPVFLRKKR